MKYLKVILTAKFPIDQGDEAGALADSTECLANVRDQLEQQGEIISTDVSIVDEPEQPE